MDSGRGHMEAIPMELYDKATDKWSGNSGVFKLGEEIEIKKAWFRVHKINSFGIMLKAIKSKSITDSEGFRVP